ncbi:MAG: hypothetical protein QXV69_03960 [Sulfolobaceae archaeon]
MNSMIVRILCMLSIALVLSSITPIIISSSAVSSTGYQVLYQKYISGILSQQTNVGYSTIYYVSNTTATVNYTSDEKGVIKSLQHQTLYTITSLGKSLQHQGYINISIVNGLLFSLKTNLPYLARVILIEGNSTQLVWAGFNATKINSYVYINSSANLVLQFLNGTKFVNISFTVTLSSKISKSLSIYLQEITVSSKFSRDSQTVIQLNYPRKYAPYISSSEINGSYVNLSSNNMNVVEAYFNGTLLPAILWSGEGKGSFSLHLGVLQSVLDIDTKFITISFYGVNGTPVAYVHDVFLSGVLSQKGLIKAVYGDLKAGELKIVKVIGAKYSKASSSAKAYVNGNQVIVIINDKGEVESTGDVEVIHNVYVNNVAGVIVNIYINGSGKVVLVTTNNQAHNVSIVVPKSVKVVNININGKTFVAQNVTVEIPSKYIMFNITLLNSSANIQVYKIVNGSLIKLNDSNYFIMNGKLVVFDDPESNYLIVYGTVQPQTTITAQSGTSSSLPQQQSSIPSPGGISSNLLYVIIGIIVVVVILAIAIVLTRRK